MSEGPAPSLHRAWIEVDHAALRHNLGVLRRLAGPEKQVIAVVKANAYGHGAIEVSRTLLAEGVELLAVATIDEGISLRRAGVTAPIIVLWALGRPEAALAVAHDLQPVVHDAAGIAMLEGAADPGRRLAVHLKVDTGLGRQGAEPDTAVELATRLGAAAACNWPAPSATWPYQGEDDAYTEVQLVRLAQSLDAMRSAGVDPGLVHVAATGGILAGPAPSPMRCGRARAVRPAAGLGVGSRSGPAAGAGAQGAPDPHLRPGRPGSRSATACATDRLAPPGSPRSASATAMAGRGCTPTTARCWCEAARRRSWEPSAWTV